VRRETWRGGRFTGDPKVMILVDAAIRHKALVGIPGVWSGTAGADHPHRALATALEVLGRDATVEGDVPPADPLPPGAIP
jgi:hypothetical protein